MALRVAAIVARSRGQTRQQLRQLLPPLLLAAALSTLYTAGAQTRTCGTSFAWGGNNPGSTPLCFLTISSER